MATVQTWLLSLKDEAITHMMGEANGPQAFSHYLIWQLFKKVWAPLSYMQVQSLLFNTTDTTPMP